LIKTNITGASPNCLFFKTRFLVLPEGGKLVTERVRDEIHLVHIRALMPLFYVKI